MIFSKGDDFMTSEQYVESVKQMMNQQNVFFGVFIAILGIVLVFVGVMQWRLSDKQLKSIKEETRSEVLEEINIKLTSNYEKTDAKLRYHNENIEKNIKLVDQLIDERNDFEHFSLDYELTRISKELNMIRKVIYLSNIYQHYLERSMGNFNFFIGKVNSMITFAYHEKNLNINNRDLDIFLDNMKKIENTFNEESFELKTIIKHISDYRE